jgi:hypothetical protein
MRETDPDLVNFLSRDEFGILFWLIFIR